MNLKQEYLRLIEIVKSRLAGQGLPAKNEDVGRTLGYKSRTSYQNLLGPKGKITADHLKQLKLHFPFLSENVTDAGLAPGEQNPVLETDVHVKLSDYLTLLKESTAKAEDREKSYQRILEKTLDNIASNLKINRGILEEVSLNVASAREVGLKSLARLENLPEAELFHEAGSNALHRMKDRKKGSSVPGGGK